MEIPTTEPQCIFSSHSGKALDVEGIKQEDGARLQQWTLYGGENQQWFFKPTEDGFCEIVAVHSGKCLDDAGSLTNGGKVQQWSRHGGDRQKWRLVPQPNGSFEIVSKLGDLRLDVAEFSLADGGRIHLWSSTGAKNQRWHIVSANKIVIPAIFGSRLVSTIDVKFGEIMAAKPPDGKFLNYSDAQMLTATVRNVFRHRLNIVPNQIEIALTLSEAVLAPSTVEKVELVKKAAGIAGGAGGIAMIITGIGVALGWGAGMIVAVKTFFIGGAFLGPVVWITGGIALAAIAAYFALTDDKAKDTERFMNALKGGLNGALMPVWAEFGDRLCLPSEPAQGK